MNPERPDADDDDAFEALLKEVGGRSAPSSQIFEEVRAAVHAEWRASVAAHARRRRWTRLAVAASVLLVVLAGVAVQRTTQIGGAQLAVDLTYSTGDVFVTPAGREAQRVKVGERFAAGDSLATKAGRAALRLGDDLEVRVDEDTLLRLIAPDRIELAAGTLYADADKGGSGRPLTIDTRLGAVRHVGTQYQVRAEASRLEILVREGRVEIAAAGAVSSGVAGERVQVDARGSVVRTAIAREDPAWRWTTRAGPPFDIENQTLDEFLTWVARETGRELVYDTPQAQAAARELKLRGSIAGLDPHAALAAVLSTTQLRRLAADEAELRIAH
jgi:ferric-dicitrate binding protein FerR (iron transport regulator)